MLLFGSLLEGCWRACIRDKSRLIKRIDGEYPLERIRKELIDICGTTEFLPISCTEMKDIIQFDTLGITTYAIAIPGNLVHVSVLDGNNISPRVVTVDHRAFQDKLLVRMAAIIDCFSNRLRQQRHADTLRIIFLPLSHKKHFPKSPTEDITPAHINSGFYVPRRIVILRHEDHQKVMLHEVLHDLFNVPFSNACVGALKRHLNIDPRVRLIPNEAIVETVAVVAQVAFLAMEKGYDTKKRASMLMEERRRCNSVRDGLFTMNQWPRRPWTKTSNVFSYIFIRSVLMTDLKLFFSLFMDAYVSRSWNKLQTFVFEKSVELRRIAISSRPRQLKYENAIVYGSD